MAWRRWVACTSSGTASCSPILRCPGSTVLPCSPRSSDLSEERRCLSSPRAAGATRKPGDGCWTWEQRHCLPNRSIPSNWRKPSSDFYRDSCHDSAAAHGSRIAMDQPLILVIDDSQTIRKLVECHLSQAGYRVAMAADAGQGLELARTLQPQLIILDHQLPGTTGEEVCRKLLEDEATARIPVVISSAMRNRAYAQYTEYPNVVDQIPKPFTPELLKSGVANALQTGAMIVQAQRTGCAIPEAVGEVHDAILEGKSAAFPPLALLDFLTTQQQTGRLTLEVGKDPIRF